MYQQINIKIKALHVKVILTARKGKVDILLF
jgi:hypothetical protein